MIIQWRELPKVLFPKFVSKKWWAKDGTVSRSRLFKRKVRRNDEGERGSDEIESRSEKQF